MGHLRGIGRLRVLLWRHSRCRGLPDVEGLQALRSHRSERRRYLLNEAGPASLASLRFRWPRRPGVEEAGRNLSPSRAPQPGSGVFHAVVARVLIEVVVMRRLATTAPAGR